ncbi:hypothetical protein K7402_04870 [Pseudomonas fluorescens group sp.]|uniref:Phage protein n=2 Tax=Pseudomonas fluorescens TaxID=294 RepID=C3KA09_PSEFS|nr:MULTISPECIES: hypothetical protein [Pseudomonas fluorescens group]MBZ6453873.1 hypothetical protein [Pseudomonas fluorescens group sp.]MBZ6459859.1 hypothetical protein [Pseudomonas fluorescens group sp.]MBZ6466750.1 hypothetical protein [Pseudomonas fluorescens group sp.]WQD75036.1 hypothetical protein U0037_14155 [Pseudomonas marginalis]CAI2797055.1 Phage protein [Pseudomonas fluorescens SBW25]
MSMKITINRKGLDQLLKNAKEMEGTHQVKLTDTLNPEFVSSHSKFSDLEDLFAASGFKIDSPEDFAAIPDDEWDKFISENTDFTSWEEMQRSGGIEYMKAKLNKGL